MNRRGLWAVLPNGKVRHLIEWNEKHKAFQTLCPQVRGLVDRTWIVQWDADCALPPCADCRRVTALRAASTTALLGEIDADLEAHQ